MHICLKGTLRDLRMCFLFVSVARSPPFTCMVCTCRIIHSCVPCIHITPLRGLYLVASTGTLVGKNTPCLHVQISATPPPIYICSYFAAIFGDHLRVYTCMIGCKRSFRCHNTTKSTQTSWVKCILNVAGLNLGPGAVWLEQRLSWNTRWWPEGFNPERYWKVIHLFSMLLWKYHVFKI